MFGRVVKTVFYLSRGTFWVFFKKKREHVHSELADSGEKINLLKKRFFFRNINYDEKFKKINAENNPLLPAIFEKKYRVEYRRN